MEQEIKVRRETLCTKHTNMAQPEVPVDNSGGLHVEPERVLAIMHQIIDFDTCEEPGSMMNVWAQGYANAVNANWDLDIVRTLAEKVSEEIIELLDALYYLHDCSDYYHEHCDDMQLEVADVFNCYFAHALLGHESRKLTNALRTLLNDKGYAPALILTVSTAKTFMAGCR